MPTTSASTTRHQWRFYRCGGLDQVSIESGADLLALGQLDSKLWATLSCPTKGVELDEKTLHLVDSDQDGRIRVAEVLAAVAWAGERLRNPDDLLKRSAVLPLSAVNEQHADGKRLLSAMRQILKTLGKEQATEITADDVRSMVAMFAQTRLNGDGIVPATAASKEDLKTLIEEMISCVGSENDRSGLPGVSSVLVDRFWAELHAHDEWYKLLEADSKRVLPFGENTASAFGLWQELAPKVEDFFTRCRLLAFDERLAERVTGSQAEPPLPTMAMLSATGESVRALPLAHPSATAELPLTDRVNPAWADCLARFKREVVEPMLGSRTQLTHEDSQKLVECFAPYQSWLAKKPSSSVEKLGMKRIRELIAGDHEKRVRALIADDLALKAEFDSISEVEKLVLYHRDLATLINNFVTFLDFFSGKHQAMFQAGTLYIDGRACELCLRVEDAGRHASLSALCNTYLAYCDCVRRGMSEKMTIVAAFTAGDAEQLSVGRNGVFFDRRGNEWDATIVKIVEHPISIGEAFWSPYRRLGRMISEQVEKFAASGDKEMQARMSSGVAEAGKTVTAGAPAPAQPFDVGRFAGIFAAIGLAIGAIGTAVASVITGFLGLSWWQMPLAIVGLLLLISGPSMVLAWLRLGKRNLGPLLDANGWAVNTRATMNVRFAQSLTKVATLPDGAKRYLEDPFADKTRPWLTYFLILALILGGGFALKKRGAIKKWLAHRGNPPAKSSIASGTPSVATGTVNPASPAAPSVVGTGSAPVSAP
ncbi:MAG TPA: hypothetical protein PKO06_00045 [Candidatus Ozemobacteraceae bacterium]|nr:hypothetical protein [Candidatus Ozemobacteraceae bacterium]